MPAFNAEEYIKEAIQSVIDQCWDRWELIIVDDGSSDKTAEIISAYHDPRIHYFYQKNKGVAAARNLALSKIRGDYFCFLDSDDILPPRSIEARIQVFIKKPTVSFVDGKVLYKNASLSEQLKTYQPDFKGFPFSELIKINPACYFGLSWMIKREADKVYLFKEDMTHAEDLFFYISIAEGKLYDFTMEEVLHYRITGSSAMTNLKGLEEGYYKLYQNIKKSTSVATKELIYLKLKITKIMVLSHCFDGKRPDRSMAAFFRYLFA